jgi:DNA-binding XRE family transcriptional regulator
MKEKDENFLDSIDPDNLKNRLPKNITWEEIINTIDKNRVDTHKEDSLYIDKSLGVMNTVNNLVEKGIDRDTVNQIYFYYINQRIKQIADRTVNESLSIQEEKEKEYTTILTKEQYIEHTKKYNLENKQINPSSFYIKSNLPEILESNEDINQTKLARLADVSRGTIVGLMKDANSITLMNAYKICNVLGLKIEDVFPLIINEQYNEQNNNNEK